MIMNRIIPLRFVSEREGRKGNKIARGGERGKNDRDCSFRSRAINYSRNKRPLSGPVICFGSNDYSAE